MTDTIMLVTTHARAARYIPLVRAAINAFWAQQPTVRFLTDGGLEPASDVYVEPETHFVPLLARGLARVRDEFPTARQIFHMLEDHCPLQPCEANRISAVVSIAIGYDMAAVSFPTYRWPWNETDTGEYPDGQVRTWRRIETQEIAGERLAIVPKNFFRYFQVQPTLWRMSYLERVCAAAMTAEVLDPWQFEAMRLQLAEQHYVSAYNWPTVHHGFLVQGRVNSAAIDFIDKKVGIDLRQQLIRDLIGTRSETAYRAQRAVLHYIRQFRSKIRHG
jgi:hypothetical protein